MLRIALTFLFITSLSLHLAATNRSSEETAEIMISVASLPTLHLPDDQLSKFNPPLPKENREVSEMMDQKLILYKAACNRGYTFLMQHFSQDNTEKEMTLFQQLPLELLSLISAQVNPHQTRTGLAKIAGLNKALFMWLSPFLAEEHWRHEKALAATLLIPTASRLPLLIWTSANGLVEGYADYQTQSKKHKFMPIAIFATFFSSQTRQACFYEQRSSLTQLDTIDTRYSWCHSPKGPSLDLGLIQENLLIEPESLVRLNIKEATLSSYFYIRLLPRLLAQTGLETLRLTFTVHADRPYFVDTTLRQFRGLKTLSLSSAWHDSCPLPQSVSQLPTLTKLKLEKITLEQPKLKALASLSTLRHLEIFSGLSAVDLPALAGFTQLTTLSLRSLHLHGRLPPEILSLTNLRNLELPVAQLSELSHDIQRLSNLQTLRLSGNYLKTVPPELFTLRELQHLDLSHNFLTYLPLDAIQQHIKRREDLCRTRASTHTLPFTIGLLGNGLLPKATVKTLLNYIKN